MKIWVSLVRFVAMSIVSVVPYAAGAQTRWPQITVGNAGIAFNDAAARKGQGLRIKQLSCSGTTCRYGGPEIQLLVGGDEKGALATEIMLVLGKESRAEDISQAVVILLTMLEPDVGKARFAKALDGFNIMALQAAMGRTAEPVDLRSMRLTFREIPNVATYLSFARYQHRP